MKQYLLVYDPDLLQDWIVPTIVENAPGVLEAYAFGNSVWLKADGDFRPIHEFLKRQYGDLQFFIVEIGPARAGSMPEEFWKFLREPALEHAAE
jgi:hypothetical protein